MLEINRVMLADSVAVFLGVEMVLVRLCNSPIFRLRDKITLTSEHAIIEFDIQSRQQSPAGSSNSGPHLTEKCVPPRC